MLINTRLKRGSVYRWVVLGTFRAPLDRLERLGLLPLLRDQYEPG